MGHFVQSSPILQYSEGEHHQVEKVDIIDRVEGKKQQQKVSKKLLMGPKLVFSKKQVLTQLVLGL